MKKASTYLFAMMAVANVGVALLISHTVGFMMRTYTDFGAVLPGITTQIVNFLWWPYIFVTIGFAGVIISLVSKMRSSVLSHALCIILIVEILLLAITAYALCYPMCISEPRIVQ